MTRKGASRIAPKGLSDVAGGHVFDDFDNWLDNSLWTGLTKAFGGEVGETQQNYELELEFQKSSRSTDLRQDVHEAIVQEAKSLTAPGEAEKRHIKLELPSDMTYTSGDYLSVLPINPSKLVKAIMTRFGLAWDTVLQIKQGQYTTLPQGRSLTASTILSEYVELNEVVTQKQLSNMAAFTADASTRAALTAITAGEITEKRFSVFSLLDQYPSIDLPFGSFLAMLPPLRTRQYSISSSPLHAPQTCTLTYSVLNVAAKSDPGKRYLGSASSYLSELNPGDRIHVAVRPSHPAFHLPLDVSTIPIIMICAGTGIAPFRGFVQQRAEQLDGGRTLAPALMYVGSRHPERDVLYKEEFEAWAEKGAVDIRYVFSRNEAATKGCKYVQDRLWKDRDELTTFSKGNAKIYLCGNGAMASEVGKTLVDIWVEWKGKGMDREKGEEWLKSIRNERFASDVFD